MTELTVPVLIVGAGPAGLAATALLGRYGIETLTISRHAGVANSPRAHITNQRTMEVFRDLGIEDRIKAAALPNRMMANNVWATTFAGIELARLNAWGSGDDRKPDYDTASPCEMCNIPQHVLDPILLETARENGGSFLFGAELQTISQQGDEVIASLVDRNSRKEIRVRALYAIGADGSNSVVAKETGIAIEGKMGVGDVVSCWFEADLARYCGYRPGVLYWMTRPDEKNGFASATFTCVRPWNEWVMTFNVDPAVEPDLSEEAIINLARSFIGNPDIPVAIKSSSRWKVNNAAAASMKKGRIFLAGDAAHRHPPTNGLGTNTSIQDSFNLAWKLALVLKGKAAPSLLETYSHERQPVARQIVDRAMKSLIDIQPLYQAFGFIPGRSAADCRESLDELFSDSAQGRARRAALDDALAAQCHLLNCHGVEMGQQYASTAVVGDGSVQQAAARDPELYYQPDTFPGASLPHAWVEYRRKRISTLDLAGHGRFTLLTGLSGKAWMKAVQHARQTLGIDIDLFAIGPGCEVLDPYGAWARLRGVQESGCVLIRPDRHVMWRAQEAAGQASALLISVMTSALWHDCAAAQRETQKVA